MHAFHQLNGEWIATMDSSTYFQEIWLQEDKNNLKGSGKVISKGEMLFTEDLTLKNENGNIYYCTSASGQNKGKEICFQLKKQTSKSFLWTNESHDFPQTISYTFKTDDSLFVKLTGFEKGKYRTEQFSFVRQK